jgi:Fe-Mn family superoxide dismutase
MTEYILPDLRYDYAALEPHLSGRIMELHHDKHHRAYVKGANAALEQLAQARLSGHLDQIAALERALAFNLSGHVLHSIFWQNMVPGGGGEPDGDFADALQRDFGSFAAFKNQLINACATIMGSGWGALVRDPLSGRLMTVQVHDHQSEFIQASTPLLVLDAWEHAYYLQYQTDKKKYFEAIWNVWNWADVAARFRSAQQIDVLVANAVNGGKAKKPRAA